MDLKAELTDVFSRSNFGKSYAVTWFFLLSGVILFFALLILVEMTVKNNFFRFILQNVGIFLVFVSFLLGNAGVQRVNNLSGKADVTSLEIFKWVSKKSYLIIIISIGVIIFLFMVILLEVAFSLIGYIPYFGHAVILISTIPMLITNFLCLLIAICIFVITPLMIGEGKGLMEIAREMIALIKKKWLPLCLYLLVFFVLLFLCLVMIHTLIKYSIGVTQSIQWNINAGYPKIISAMSKKTFFSDIIVRLTPNANSLEAFKKFGFKVFDYLTLLKYSIGFVYLISFSFIMSFPLAVFFNFTSIFYNQIQDGE